MDANKQHVEEAPKKDMNPTHGEMMMCPKCGHEMSMEEMKMKSMKPSMDEFKKMSSAEMRKHLPVKEDE